MGDEQKHLLPKQYPLGRDFRASARSVLQISVSLSLLVTSFKLEECVISSVGQRSRCLRLNHSSLSNYLHQEQNHCRLQVQHLLWNIRLGYLLHPSIFVASGPSMRIADIGTGNA